MFRRHFRESRPFFFYFLRTPGHRVVISSVKIGSRVNGARGRFDKQKIEALLSFALLLLSCNVIINIIIKGKKQMNKESGREVKGLYPRAGSATGNRCSCDTGSFERVLPVNVRAGRASGASSLSSTGGRYRWHRFSSYLGSLPPKRTVLYGHTAVSSTVLLYQHGSGFAGARLN